MNKKLIITIASITAVAFAILAGLAIWNMVEVKSLKKDYEQLRSDHNSLVETVLSVEGFIEAQVDFNEAVTDLLLMY